MVQPLGMVQPSDLDKTESDGRDPPQGVAPHARRGVVGTRTMLLMEESPSRCVLVSVAVYAPHRCENCDN